MNNLSKSDRKHGRKLVSLAWERSLRIELVKLGEAIAQMQAGTLSPFEADRIIHNYHNGIARELFNFYTGSDLWFGLMRACREDLLTVDELAGLSESTLKELQRWTRVTEEE